MSLGVDILEEVVEYLEEEEDRLARIENLPNQAREAVESIREMRLECRGAINHLNRGAVSKTIRILETKREALEILTASGVAALEVPEISETEFEEWADRLTQIEGWLPLLKQELQS